MKFLLALECAERSWLRSRDSFRNAIEHAKITVERGADVPPALLAGDVIWDLIGHVCFPSTYNYTT